MRVISEELTVSISDIDTCLIALHDEIQSTLTTIDFKLATSDRSNSMKLALRDATEPLKKFKWIARTRDGQAPFSIDASYSCNKKCGSFHIVNIVVCLNNRETIGSNFLKIEVAALAEIRKYQDVEILDSNVLGILITLDRDVLSTGHWDPAYADSSEYAAALRKFYKPFIKSNIISLRFHC